MFYLILGLTTVTLAMLMVKTRLPIEYNEIAFNVFDFLTSLYTYLRITIEPYNPLKPRLRIYTMCYYFDYVREVDNKMSNACRVTSGWLMGHDSISLRNRIVEARNFISEQPVALSIVYSFSDWNEKYVKLVDLRLVDLKRGCESPTDSGTDSDFILKIITKSMPDYDPLNYDYSVDVETNDNDKLFSERDIPIVKANLEAYLRRTSTWEAEQSLRLLSERPELMEFLYSLKEAGEVKPDSEIGTKFHGGLFSFVASDELGTEFTIKAAPLHK